VPRGRQCLGSRTAGCEDEADPHGDTGAVAGLFHSSFTRLILRENLVSLNGEALEMLGKCRGEPARPPYELTSKSVHGG